MSTGPQLALQVPDELTGGVYSNLIAVWHTPYEFTIDFAVMGLTQTGTDDDGQSVPVIPGQVVARVKIPPAVVFQLMQALSTNEQAYVSNIGPIPIPGRQGDESPLFPPDEQ